MMKYSGVNLNKVLGVHTRARRKLGRCLDQYFESPLLHKEIHSPKVYVPLNLNKAWNQKN